MSSVVVAGDTSGSVTISAPAVSGSSVLTLPAVTDTLVGLAATQTLTNKTVTAPVLSGTITGTYTLGGTPTVTGTLTAGTSCVYGPSINVNVKTTQAHGLGVVPAAITAYGECMTAELGYSIGDRVVQKFGGDVNGFDVTYDSTNIIILTSNNVALTVINKTTPGGKVGLTPANWRIVATPYKIN